MAETATAVKWLQLDRARRRRVARAVRRGRAVDDPRDAPYAVGFADASLDWLSWKRRFRPVHLLLFTLVLAELVLTGGWRPALVLYPLLGFAFLRLRAPRLRKRATAARELNAELARQLRLPPVPVRMPGQAFFRPGSRFRRRFVLSLVLLLAAALALAVAATAWTIRETTAGRPPRTRSARASTHDSQRCRARSSTRSRASCAGRPEGTHPAAAQLRRVA